MNISIKKKQMPNTTKIIVILRFGVIWHLNKMYLTGTSLLLAEISFYFNLFYFIKIDFIEFHFNSMKSPVVVF